MDLFRKLRSGGEATHSRRGPGSANGPAGVSSGALDAGRNPGPRIGRLSNGLQEFLLQLEGIRRPQLLDLGSARQTTIAFFIERGYKVYTEDLLTGWKSFLDAEVRSAREPGPEDPDALEMLPAERAKRFLANALQYPPDTFDAVLLWDLLDYLDGELAPRLLARVSSLIRDGGVVLAMFHMREPEAFHRFRVLDAQNLELVPAPGLVAPQRVYQNREISDLFRRFRSCKTFVGRDQLRESVFIK